MPIGEKLRQDLDAYSLVPIFRRRNDIFNELEDRKDIVAAFGDYYQDVVPLIIDIFAQRLKISAQVAEQTLYALLSHINDGYPRRRDYRKAAWIMSANLDRLRMHQALEPFTFPLRREWMPVAIVDYWRENRIKDHRQVRGGVYIFRGLGGSAAAVEFRKFFSGKARGFIHYQMLKLPKFKKIGPREFVGMYSWVLLDPELRGINFDRIGCTPIFVKHNRALYRERQTPCPLGYAHACFHCHVGHDTCWRGTHKYTYVARDSCLGCKESPAWFREDDDSSVKFCIVCRRTMAQRRKLCR